jgi:type I restriction enzyme S subunit
MSRNLFYLEKIPNDWNRVFVKKLFNIGRGRVISQEELEENGKYPVYSSQTKNDGCLGYINTYDFDCDQITWTTDGANAGTIFLRTGKYNCTNVCGTLQLKEQLKEQFNLKYLKYMLEYSSQYHKRADTNGYKIMNNEMARIKIAFPNLEEQERIANYLDKKVSKIDQVIEDNQNIIELLEEYKENILKNELEKIETETIKLKYLISKSLQYGANSSGVLFENKLPRYIRITDIENENLKDKDKLSLNEEEAQNFILEDGDILFARSGGTVGKTFQYFSKYGRCAFAGYLIRARFNNINLAKYVYNFTKTNYYNNWKDSIFIQSTIQNIGADKYSIFPVIVPKNKNNIKEINKIVESKKIKINEAINYRKQIIEKLEEYKKSLIYEVVTGKVEVQ